MQVPVPSCFIPSSGLRPPPCVISSPPSKPLRLRGALALTGQQLHNLNGEYNLTQIRMPYHGATVEKAIEVSCQCDQWTQTDFMVEVVDVGTEQCRADVSSQAMGYVDAISRSTERFVQDVAVQSMPNCLMTIDAWTMPCVDEKATQSARLVMFNDVGVNTNECTTTVSVQTTANSTDIVHPTSFKMLASLVHKVMDCTTMRQESKNLLIKRINRLLTVAEGLNSSFGEILTCLESSEFEGHQSLDELSEIYVSDEEIENTNMVEMSRLFQIDPLLTSQVLALLTQRYPSLSGNQAALQITAYRELLVIHQMKAQAAANSQVRTPPGLRSNGFASSVSQGESTDAEAGWYSTGLSDSVAKIMDCSNPSQPLSLGSHISRLTCGTDAASSLTAAKNSNSLSSGNHLSVSSVTVRSPKKKHGLNRLPSPVSTDEHLAMDGCRKKPVIRTHFNPQSFKNYTTTDEERDRTLVLNTARNRQKPTKKAGGSTSSKK